MLFKTKTPTTYTIATATAQLDEILARAAADFVPADRLVDLMESRIAAIRARQAAAYSAAPVFASGSSSCIAVGVKSRCAASNGARGALHSRTISGAANIKFSRVKIVAA
jgi:hypothetical protein